MNQRRIYRRNTIGQNTRVFVAKDVDYSTEADFTDFVDNAVDGEMGIFLVAGTDNSDAEAAIKANALVAGDNFFIAQMQVQPDGERLVKKTPVYNYNDIKRKKKEDFCLPVRQVSDIGWNGTNGDIADVVPAVLVGDIFSVSIIETTEGYQPMPTWNYEYVAKAGDTLVQVVAGLAAAINDANSVVHKENPPIVSATVNSNGTGAGGAGNQAGLRITALETQLTFEVTVKEELRDALIRLFTPMTYGSGFKEDVAYIEREGQIFDGTTTVNAMFRDEHGRQVNYANATLAYDYIHLDMTKRFESKAYKNSEDTQDSYILIAVPASINATAPYTNTIAGTDTPVGNFETVLGL